MLQYKFMEFIPSSLEEGVLYITIEYKTASHLCICGCGNKVITPITPTDWKLTYDGSSVSLSPSIGNWNFACKSHYWIRRNEIVMASLWSEDRISNVRKRDEENKKKYFKKRNKK